MNKGNFCLQFFTTAVGEFISESSLFANFILGLLLF